MKRYIYCPDDNSLNEATELAKKIGIPILIGDNKDSKNINFDRSSVCVIKIPENKSISLLYNDVPAGFHQSVKYTNEFKNLKNNTNMFINNILIKPLYEEMHVVKYNYLCDEIGQYSCTIMVDNEKQEEFHFVVN